MLSICQIRLPHPVLHCCTGFLDILSQKKPGLIFLRAFSFISTCISVSISVYVYMYMYTHEHTSPGTSILVCMHVCTHICVRAFIHSISVSKSLVTLFYLQCILSLLRNAPLNSLKHTKPWFLSLKCTVVIRFSIALGQSYSEGKEQVLTRGDVLQNKLRFSFFSVSCDNASDSAFVSSTKLCQEDARDLIIGLWQPFCFCSWIPVRAFKHYDLK